MRGFRFTCVLTPHTLWKAFVSRCRGHWIQSRNRLIYCFCHFFSQSWSSGDWGSDRFMSDWRSGVRIQINTSCSLCYQILNCWMKLLHPPGARTRDSNKMKRDLLRFHVLRKSLGSQGWNTGNSYINLSATFYVGCCKRSLKCSCFSKMVRLEHFLTLC